MKKIISATVVVGIAASLLYVFLGNDPAKVHEKEVLNARNDTESFMARDEESPFVGADKTFMGLSYFKIDPKFKVKAQLEKIKRIAYVKVPTSDGQSKNYLKYGIIRFEIDQKPLELLALRPVTGKNDFLFVPFTDETSAFETYGAGRYLEIPFEKETDKITLDFNLAFNPYCAYVDDYSCPLPPRENHLEVRITAGEKTYDH
jgi:hypothetical protein